VKKIPNNLHSKLPK